MGEAERRAADVRLGHVTFAGYTQIEGTLDCGSVYHGVLRNAGETILWTCTHEHDSSFGAISCAYQAEGQARAAALLPDRPQVHWNDEATWPQGFRKERLHRQSDALKS